MLLQVAKRFLQYLKQIDKIYNYMERQLYKSQRNKELIQLLDLEKSLVYFNTSLKANEVTLEKILRGRIITLYEEDHDLLEDVLIEVRQAIEMANIYSSIISGMMDAFASRHLQQPERHHEGADLHYRFAHSAEYHLRILWNEHHRRPAPGSVLVDSSDFGHSDPQHRGPDPEKTRFILIAK